MYRPPVLGLIRLGWHHGYHAVLAVPSRGGSKDNNNSIRLLKVQQDNNNYER